MKNSNSRDKYAKTQLPANDNRLMKTANQTRNNDLQKTAINRPTSGKQLPGKNVPKGPIPKKQFIVEDNMTVSRVNEAKQGLQLLKKKMSAKGMSREKVKVVHEEKFEKPNLRSTQKVEDENDNYNIPPRNMMKKTSSTTQNPPKNQNSRQPEQRNPPKQQAEQKQRQEQYQAPQMEIPIKAKKDFNALLEEELRKENKSKVTHNQVSEYPEDQGELIQCSEGCGRMFNSHAIAKHEKICQKVFQSKRKAFNAAERRAPEVEGFNKPPEMPSKKQPAKQPAKQAPKTQEKIPKWKAQSLAFRAGLKQGKGQQLTQEEKQAMNSGPENDFVQCKFCGRKFNSTAAARHIPFCETKAKQVPKKKR